MNGSKTQAGWENLFITGKWQVYTNAAHEFVTSLGIIREIGGTGTTHTGADRYGSTTPTLYAGKGLGDLPIGMLRPLAVTGELGYTIARLDTGPRQPISRGLYERRGYEPIENFNANPVATFFGQKSLQ